MSHEWFTLDGLSRHLGRTRREVEKLANRGRIPGRKVSGEWQFHPTEIRHWLEHEMREYTEGQLRVIEKTQESTEADADVPVSSLLRVETVAVPLDARTKPSVLEGLVEVAGRTWQVWEPAIVLEAVQEREAVLSTGFDNGVAIPHPRNPRPDAYGESIIAFGRTMSGIPFGAPKRQLSDLFFLVLCRDVRTHLLVLARLGRMLQLPHFVDKLRESDNSVSTYETICATDQQVAEDK